MTRTQALAIAYSTAKTHCPDERKRAFQWMLTDTFLRLKMEQTAEVRHAWDDEEMEERKTYWAAKRAKKAA